MKTFFAWKTIDPSHFNKEILYLYGNPAEAGDFSAWNSIQQDLGIQVSITPKPSMPSLSDYLLPGEQAGIVLNWRGDGKFSGCSDILPFDPSTPTLIRCTIGKGYCANNLFVGCQLIIRSPAGQTPDEWPRPWGSVIADIPISDNIRIGEGSAFPLWECNGDGSKLIQWDFTSSFEDLEIPLMSAVAVVIDKAHPFISKGDYKVSKPIVNLMIIQQFARKSFHPDIFEALIDHEQNKKRWPTDSLGYSLNALLKKISTRLNIVSFQDLKETYARKPEIIDQTIDIIFSPTLKL